MSATTHDSSHIQNKCPLLWRRWQEVRLHRSRPRAGRRADCGQRACFPLRCPPAILVPSIKAFSTRLRRIQPEVFSAILRPLLRPYLWRVLANTLIMGLGAATGGTLLGFIFAYALVRCSFPFGRLVHVVTLLPTISPPFAIAIANDPAFRAQWPDHPPGAGHPPWRGQRHLRAGRADLCVDYHLLSGGLSDYPLVRCWSDLRLDGGSRAELRLRASFTSSARSHCRCWRRASRRRFCCSLSSRWPTLATRCCSAATPASDRNLPVDQRPVRPAKRRGAFPGAAAPDADDFLAAALLHQPPLLHRRHGQAYGQGASLSRSRSRV